MKTYQIVDAAAYGAESGAGALPVILIAVLIIVTVALGVFLTRKSKRIVQEQEKGVQAISYKA